MRMKNELRVAAGLILALALAGCGTTTPQPRPVTAHGVVLREPLVSPRPYGAADRRSATSAQVMVRSRIHR